MKESDWLYACSASAYEQRTSTTQPAPTEVDEWEASSCIQAQSQTEEESSSCWSFNV